MKSWTDRREEDMVLSEIGTITGLQIGIVRGGGKSHGSRGPRDLRFKALVFTSQNLLDPCSPMIALRGHESAAPTRCWFVGAHVLSDVTSASKPRGDKNPSSFCLEEFWLVSSTNLTTNSDELSPNSDHMIDGTE
ncbi:hypothetical protein D5086_014462 [Populus alba]|uniref:Uncharacterized protein n=1 Tax=Populus alba TaxID=43335 RepID=A0ACC4BZF7_POPAL